MGLGTTQSTLLTQCEAARPSRVGTHVYHSSEDDVPFVPFVPTGQLYIECSSKTPGEAQAADHRSARWPLTHRSGNAGLRQFPQCRTLHVHANTPGVDDSTKSTRSPFQKSDMCSCGQMSIRLGSPCAGRIIIKGRVIDEFVREPSRRRPAVFIWQQC